MNEVLIAVKKTGKSPVYIIATAAVTLLALLSIWNIIESIVNYSSYSYLYDTYTFAGELVVYIGSFILSMVTAIGMILFFVSSLSSKDTMPTTGLTMIKISQVIQLVFATIGFVFAFLIGLVLLIVPNIIGIDNIMDYIYQYTGYNVFDPYAFGYYLDFASIFNIIVIVMLVFIVIGAVLVFLYYMKILRTVKSVKNAITTQKPNNKGSVYIIVINIILSFFVLIGLISSIYQWVSGTLYLGTTTAILTIISSLLSLVAYLFIAITIITYRGRMKNLLYGGYNANPSIPPVQTYSENQTTNQEQKAEFCTGCGNKLEPGSMFCTSCGKKQ